MYTYRSLFNLLSIGFTFFSFSVFAYEGIPSGPYISGSLPGNVSVSPSGAAQYSVPIVIPKGVGDYQPNLAFSYDSNRGNGLMGKGWALSAGSASIKRCGPSRKHDGISHPVNYSTRDKFCLGGKRLHLLSGSYGYPGSIYGFEIDDFSRVEAVGGSGGHPSYFIQTIKSGHKIYYGKSSNSRFVKSSNNRTLKWSVSEKRDRSENKISYHYHNANNQFYLTSIRYAYSGSYGAEVKLHYESRPDTLTGFQHQQKLIRNVRLQQVDVLNDFRTVKQYKIFYASQVGAINNLSKLVALQECANFQCFEPSVFEWTENKLGWRPAAASQKFGFAERLAAPDLNKDGYDDIVMTIKHENGLRDKTLAYALGGSQGGFKNFTTLEQHNRHRDSATIKVNDLNGDGRPDLSHYSDFLNSFTSNDDSFQIDESPTVLLTEIGLYVDIDQNGTLDMVSAGDLKVGTWKNGRTFPYMNQIKVRLGSSRVKNEKMDFGPEYLVSLPAPVGRSDWVGYYRNLKFADVDGDGDQELFLHHAMVRDPSNNEIDNKSPRTKELPRGLDSTYILEIPEKAGQAKIVSSFIGRSLESERLYLRDINQDGLVDVIVTVCNALEACEDITFNYRINQGLGVFSSLYDVTVGGFYPRSSGVYVKDYNMDGFPDLWAENKPVYIWNAGKFDRLEDDVLNLDIPNFNTRYTITKLRYAYVTGGYSPDLLVQNNKTEICRKVFCEPDGGETQVFNPLNSEPILKIKSFTNGFGARTEVDYEKMNLSTHYRGSGDPRSTSNKIKDSLCLHEFGGGCSTIYDGGIDSQSELIDSLQKGFYTPPGAPFKAKDKKISVADSRKNIVTKVRHFKHVAHDTSPGDTNLESVEKHYFYARARNQNQRGSLGFETMVIYDPASDIETQTVYRQDYPLIGTPYISQTRVASTGQVVSTKYTEHGFKRDTIPKISYAKRVTEIARGNNSRAVIKNVLTENTIDDWGNITGSLVTTTGNENERRVITANNAYGDSNEQRYGLMRSSSLNTSISGAGLNESITKTQAFSYYSNGLLDTVTVEPNKPEYRSETKNHYDDYGNIIQTAVSATGLATRRAHTEYDAIGRFVSKTRDGKNQLVQHIVERNSLGQPMVIQDANGGEIVIEYDAFGRETLRTPNTGGWQKNSYLNCSETECRAGVVFVVRAESADGAWSEQQLDAWGRVLRTRKAGFDGTPILNDTDYYADGSIRYLSTPYFDTASYAEHWTRFEYNDALGRLTKTTRPDGSVSNRYYHGLASIFTNAKNQRRLEFNNALGHTVHIVDALGGEVKHIYGAHGNLRFSTALGSANDRHNIQTELRYDHLGRKTYMDDPSKGVWHYKYSAFGDLTEQTDAIGEKQTFKYDKLGRKTHRYDVRSNGRAKQLVMWFFDGASPDGQAVQNAVGNLSGMFQSVITNVETCQYASLCRRMEYDAYGRPIKQIDRNGYLDKEQFTLEFQYDSLGRKYREFDAADNKIGKRSGVTYRYNNYGFQYRVDDVASSQTLFEIGEVNARGQVRQSSLGGTIASNIATKSTEYYDDTGRVQSVFTLNNLGMTVQNIYYEWDQLGNLVYRQNTSGITNTARDTRQNDLEETFCYDELNRLIKASAGSVGCSGVTTNTQDVQYNVIGNVTYKKGVGTFTYGQNGASPYAVTSTSNGVSYNYNSRGDRLKWDGKSASWGINGKPISLNVDGQSVSSFKYGPNDERLSRTDIGVSVFQMDFTHYLGNIEIIKKGNSDDVEWRRTVGDITIKYITRNGSLISESTSYLLKDYQGSVDVILDNNGSVKEIMSFDAWGKRRRNWDGASLPISALSNYESQVTTRGYTEHEMLDDVGLIHMNGRVFDPTTARFISADILVPDPMDTQSYNRYSYVRNRPFFYTDPTGYEENGDEPGREEEEELESESMPDLEEIVVTGTKPSCDEKCRNNDFAKTELAQTAIDMLGDINDDFHSSVDDTLNELDSSFADPIVSHMEVGGAVLTGTTAQHMAFITAYEQHGLNLKQSIFYFLSTGGVITTFSTGKTVVYSSVGLQDGVGLGNTTSIASIALAGADLGNTVAMCQSGVCFNQWQGANGKWYNLAWGGNQWAGARRIALFYTQSFKLVGKGLTVASAGVELIEMGVAVNNRDAIGVADSGLDLTMMGPTVLGGPVGFGLGVGYTVIDNTIGWRGPHTDVMTDMLCSATGNC